MILRRWAEELRCTNPPKAEIRRAIDLHVADTATAFFAGCRTADAKALAQFFIGNELANAPTARRAAAAAAIVRHTECDDIHMASCITPGSVVVPVALAFASPEDGGLQRFDRAVIAGYAAGCRLGASLGGTEALNSGIWPTYFAAPLMAAATASVCLGLDAGATASAIGIAAAGAGGRAGRTPATPSGRWLALGEAVAKGCHAAAAAAAGFQGDADIVSGDWLTALAHGVKVRPDMLLAGTMEDHIRSVGFKQFVAARQTVNAIHAFQTLLARESIDAAMIDRVEVGVPTINAAMTARPVTTGDRLGTISSMAFQIAAAAIRPALLSDIERQDVPDPEIAAFSKRVDVIANPALDGLLPDMWAAWVRVTVGGHEFIEKCTATPGDSIDGAEQLIRQKLSRMVPAGYQHICTIQMEYGDDVDRKQRRETLWQAMLAGTQLSR